MLQSDQKQKAYANESGGALPIVLVVILALIIGALIMTSQKDAKQNIKQPLETEASLDVEGAETSTAAAVVDVSDTDTKNVDASPSVTDAVTTGADEVVAADVVTLDVEALGTPRILGNIDAPVKISEHSSFTCGGCARFHSENFKNIKRDYIDTGKAYLVFDDFPRNQYDILIGAAARCVPDQAYFNFIQLLFDTQKEWLNEDYMSYVKQNAALAGADKDVVDACIENEDLQKILANRQEAANKTHNVNSTPTLVINDGVTIGGLDKYLDIRKAIDAAFDAAEK